MTRPPSPLLALAWLLAAALLLAGCASSQPVPVVSPGASPAPTGGHIAPSPTSAVDGVQDMSAAQKHADLDSAFVAEWPVAAGKVVGVKLVSGNELHFAVDVAAPASSVAQWYRTTMTSRAFLLGGESASSDGTALTLTFSRAGVNYVVRVSSTGGATARVNTAIARGVVPKVP